MEFELSRVGPTDRPRRELGPKLRERMRETSMGFFHQMLRAGSADPTRVLEAQARGQEPRAGLERPLGDCLQRRRREESGRVRDDRREGREPRKFPGGAFRRRLAHSSAGRPLRTCSDVCRITQKRAPAPMRRATSAGL